MKYIETGYKDLGDGTFVKTYAPLEDGTPATDKQKNAMRNMLMYLSDDSKLRDKDKKRIEKMTKVEALFEIKKLIREMQTL